MHGLPDLRTYITSMTKQGAGMGKQLVQHGAVRLFQRRSPNISLFGRAYQASTFGPSSAPMAAGTSMPSTYQKPIKLAAISGQCRQ